MFKGGEERRMRELIIPVGDDECTRKIERVYGIRGELIRCKDCKYFHLYEVKSVTLSLCERKRMNAIEMDADDYCSRAERKADD